MIRILPPVRLFRSCLAWTLPLCVLSSACSSADGGVSSETSGTQAEELDEPPRRDEPVPSAGAPDYLHFGRNGLCTNHGQGFHVPDAGGIVFDEKIGLLVIKQGTALRSELRMYVDDKGTADWYDDTVEVELYQAYEGVLGPPTLISRSLPYYAPPGGIGGWTTSGEPENLAVLKAEFTSGSEEDRVASLVNDTRIPMRGSGHFGQPWQGGADGFIGGSGPDCVIGSNHDDVILGRGGTDFLRGKYGNDFLSGGPDNDTVEGNSDNDILEGNKGVDKLVDGSGEDCFRGGEDGERDVLIANTSFVTDFPRYEKEPGTINGVAVDNIEYLVTNGGNGFTGVTACP